MLMTLSTLSASKFWVLMCYYLPISTKHTADGNVIIFAHISDINWTNAKCSCRWSLMKSKDTTNIIAIHCPVWVCVLNIITVQPIEITAWMRSWHFMFLQNYWYLYICTCHQLRTMLTFLQNISSTIHITWLWPDRHIGRWKGWWCSHRKLSSPSRQFETAYQYMLKWNHWILLARHHEAFQHLFVYHKWI